ncbi:MAG: B12-binding domain-containing radical SAM protein [Desulfovibrionaceae bacterium]|nr:B12-binding domain-containing radical SAM protein [Desulfovibrionaceae bacterium]MBF0514096.1 B12-binding domain-containing radical SAM protein [Desulfovibrionaceae bacterium]
MLLINSSPKNALKIFQPFLPIFIPVGVGSLASYFMSKGVTIDIADEQVADDMLSKVENYAQKAQGRLIFGFSALTASLDSALGLSKTIKDKYPDACIIFGGIHPTAMPEEILAYQHIDFVVRGEGEMPLFELYAALKEGRDPEGIKSLSFRKNGLIVHNDMLTATLELDDLPEFPYHLFLDKRYDLGFVVSSRGCPYNCIFCSNRIPTGKKYRFVKPEKTAATLEMLNQKYGVSFVLFLDDNFLVHKPRVYELIDEIKKRGLHEKMTFSFQARGDNTSEKLLRDLFAVGFRSVFFGMETSSEEIMKTIRKGETVKECVDAVNLAKKIGFHVSATFIFGLPGETHEDRIKAIELAKELRLDQVRFNNATPYPGTELHDIAVASNRLYVDGVYKNFLSVGTFIESPFHPIPFSYLPPDSTEREIRNDILLAYLAFYLNFSKLKEIFFKPKQGSGWFNAGEDLLQLFKKIPSLAFLFLNISVKFLKLFADIFFSGSSKIRSRDLMRLMKN